MTSWRWEWSDPAIESLRRIHWLDAGRIDEAVQRLARTGEGELYRLPGDDAVTARMRIGSYGVRLTRDRRERVVRVWYVYRV
jgi:hypothetical protein